MEAITGNEWATHPKNGLEPKKLKVSEQNYFCMGGKERKVNFYEAPIPAFILILITYLVTQINK